MLGVFKNAKFWIGVGCFAGGVFATSKAARKLVVKGMATGMKTKDTIVAGWNNVKEEAGDLYDEAKEEAAALADDENTEITPVQSAAVKISRGKTSAKAKK